MNQRAGADLSSARDRGELGARRAAAKADRLDESWRAGCLAQLREYATERPDPFLAEHVGLRVPHDADPRALGSILQAARRLGWIKAVGYAPSAHSNGSPKCLWQSRISHVPSAAVAQS